MISSEDIRRVTFDRSMRGYRCDDVDDYLKQVADSMDALTASNEELQKKLVVLAQRIEQYRAEEDTLRTTMINAQRLGENVIRESKQKAAEIIRAANIKAEDREQHARDEVELARQELVTLKREADAFKKNLLDMYRKHIKLLSKIPEYLPEEEQAAPVEQAVRPEPAPAQEPVYQAPQEYAPDPVYEEPKQPEPAPTQPEKIDTVEFAITPETAPEDPAVQSETVPEMEETRFQPGAGLYDEMGEEPPAKKPVRKKAARKPKAAAPAQEEALPAAFDSFEGVDFDS